MYFFKSFRGLLGGHVAALALIEYDSSRMSWYNNELLNMAVELGNRLLPAFNTTTGLPFPHINLRTGQPEPIVSFHQFIFFRKNNTHDT